MLFVFNKLVSSVVVNWKRKIMLKICGFGRLCKFVWKCSFIYLPLSLRLSSKFGCFVAIENRTWARGRSGRSGLQNFPLRRFFVDIRSRNFRSFRTGMCEGEKEEKFILKTWNHFWHVWWSLVCWWRYIGDVPDEFSIVEEKFHSEKLKNIYEEIWVPSLMDHCTVSLSLPLALHLIINTPRRPFSIENNAERVLKEFHPKAFHVSYFAAGGF